MKYEDAKNLHNEDEVLITELGEKVSVLSTSSNANSIFIYAVSSRGYEMLHHSEIE